jgi:hypothetical protein
MRFGTIAMALAIALQATAANAAARRCDIHLNVTDQDPAGLNVRAAPSASAAVVTRLKAKDAWVQVHVTGSDGGWMSIDDAILYDDNLPTGERTLWKGKGWVAVSKLGTEEMNAGALILAEPREGARRLMKIPTETPETRPITILGCDGYWANLRIGTVTGWSMGFCSNQYTTCN